MGATGIKALAEFVERYGHTLVPTEFVTNKNFKLGIWVGNRRKDYKNGDLSEKRIAEIEAFPVWTRSPLDSKFETGFNELVEFERTHKHTQVPTEYISPKNFPLGQWVASRRQDYKTGILNQHRIRQLEVFSGWTWDVLDLKWDQNFSDLREFSTREKHVNVPKQYRGSHGRRLDVWIRAQRRKFKRNELSEEKIKLLETIEEWFW